MFPFFGDLNCSLHMPACSLEKNHGIKFGKVITIFPCPCTITYLYVNVYIWMMVYTSPPMHICLKVSFEKIFNLVKWFLVKFEICFKLCHTKAPTYKFVNQITSLDKIVRLIYVFHDFGKIMSPETLFTRIHPN